MHHWPLLYCVMAPTCPPALTRAEPALVQWAADIIALAVLAIDAAVAAAVAGALAAHAVPMATAHWLAGLGTAVILAGGLVLVLGALAARAQPAGEALAHAALVRPVALAAHGAVGLRQFLAAAVALEIHHHLQRVPEANRLQREGLGLLSGAAPRLQLDAERHLRGGVRGPERTDTRDAGKQISRCPPPLNARDANNHQCA